MRVSTNLTDIKYEDQSSLFSSIEIKEQPHNASHGSDK